MASSIGELGELKAADLLKALVTRPHTQAPVLVMVTPLVLLASVISVITKPGGVVAEEENGCLPSTARGLAISLFVPPPAGGRWMRMAIQGRRGSGVPLRSPAWGGAPGQQPLPRGWPGITAWSSVGPFDLISALPTGQQKFKAFLFFYCNSLEG